MFCKNIRISRFKLYTILGFFKKVFGQIKESIRTHYKGLYFYFSKFFKKLLLGNAYFVDFHHENLSPYNIVGARARKELDLDIDIENDSYYFDQDLDYDSLYTEYKSRFLYQYPVFTFMGYIFILSLLYLILSILFSHGAGTILHDAVSPSLWQFKYPQVSEYVSFWGFIGMFYLFVISDIDDEFTIIYLRFLLGWDLKMWFHRTILTIIKFESIFVFNSKKRTAIKESFETEDFGRIRVFKDEEVFFRKPEFAAEQYFDTFFGPEDIYDPQDLLLVDDFKLSLSLQHTINFWAFLYLLQYRENSAIDNLRKDRALRTRVNMNAYSLIRVRLGELRSQAEPFLEIPDLAFSRLTGNRPCTTSYKELADLKKFELLRFLVSK